MNIKVKCTNGNCGYVEEIDATGIFLDSKYNQLTRVEEGWVRCTLCGTPVIEIE